MEKVLKSHSVVPQSSLSSEPSLV